MEGKVGEAIVDGDRHQRDDAMVLRECAAAHDHKADGSGVLAVEGEGSADGATTGGGGGGMNSITGVCRMGGSADG